MCVSLYAHLGVLIETLELIERIILTNCWCVWIVHGITLVMFAPYFPWLWCIMPSHLMSVHLLERRFWHNTNLYLCLNITLSSVLCQAPVLFPADRLICSVMYAAVSQGCFLWTNDLTGLDHFDSILQDWQCFIDLFQCFAFCQTFILTQIRIKDMST